MSEPQRNTMISARDALGMTAIIFFVGAVSLFVVLSSLSVYCITELLP